MIGRLGCEFSFSLVRDDEYKTLILSDFRHKKIHIVQEQGQRVTETLKGPPRLHDCHLIKVQGPSFSLDVCHSSSHPPSTVQPL